jgi:hypothetical protein
MTTVPAARVPSSRDGCEKNHRPLAAENWCMRDEEVGVEARNRSPGRWELAGFEKFEALRAFGARDYRAGIFSDRRKSRPGYIKPASVRCLRLP